MLIGAFPQMEKPKQKKGLPLFLQSLLLVADKVFALLKRNEENFAISDIGTNNIV